MCARKLLQKGDNCKNSSVFKFFGPPQLGQATGAGPWLLSGVKAEPVQVAEPPWKGLLGDGNSWTSPRHCWKGQQMEAASGQILTWPFLPAVLQSTGGQTGLPFPWPPCLWRTRVCRPASPLLPTPPSAAQPCPCPGKPSCGLRHFVPYWNALSFPDRAGYHSQASRWWGHRPSYPSPCVICYRFPGNSPSREKWVASYIQMSPEPLWAMVHLSLGLCPKQGPFGPLHGFLTNQKSNPGKQRLPPAGLGVEECPLNTHNFNSPAAPFSLFAPPSHLLQMIKAFLLPRWLLKGRTEVRYHAPTSSFLSSSVLVSLWCQQLSTSQRVNLWKETVSIQGVHSHNSGIRLWLCTTTLHFQPPNNK